MSDSVLTSQKYPNLDFEGYTPDSLESTFYNCIAWSLGISYEWWWPHQDTAWPAKCPQDETIEAFEAMYSHRGYEPCANDSHEHGFEKIALYSIQEKPTHAARQLPNGEWTSKIGRHIDIVHTLRGLEGPHYGNVVRYFRKPVG